MSAAVLDRPELSREVEYAEAVKTFVYGLIKLIGEGPGELELPPSEEYPFGIDFVVKVPIVRVPEVRDCALELSYEVRSRFGARLYALVLATV